MSAAAVVFTDLVDARRAAGRGEAVARLAPLSRWIVVTAEDFDVCAIACGWVLDVPSPPLARQRCIDCDGFVEASRPDAERCGACQAVRDEGPIHRSIVVRGLPAPASERIARALWSVQDRAFGRVSMPGQEG